jgi:hypothetical protein
LKYEKNEDNEFFKLFDWSFKILPEDVAIWSVAKFG